MNEIPEQTGLEPATSHATGQHSYQLSYRSALTCSPNILMNKKRGDTLISPLGLFF